MLEISKSESTLKEIKSKLNLTKLKIIKNR